jgi:hypothetical protein
MTGHCAGSWTSIREGLDPSLKRRLSKELTVRGVTRTKKFARAQTMIVSSTASVASA